LALGSKGMPPRLSGFERLRHDGSCLPDDLLQVRLVAKALGVDLVDVLGAARPRGEPAARGYDLEPTDLGVVAGRLDELGEDRLARQRRGLDRLRRELLQRILLRRRGRGVDAGVDGASQLARDLLIEHAGVLAGAREALRLAPGHDDALFVRAPDGAVAAQEGGARALLSGDVQPALEQPWPEPPGSHRSR